MQTHAIFHVHRKCTDCVEIHQDQFAQDDPDHFYHRIWDHGAGGDPYCY